MVAMHGKVTCKGLSFLFVSNNNAPDSWKRVNPGTVKFYIQVSSQKGLQAFPVCPLLITSHNHASLDDKPAAERRIVVIENDKGLVYFAPPDHACCTAIWNKSTLSNRQASNQTPVGGLVRV